MTAARKLGWVLLLALAASPAFAIESVQPVCHERARVCALRLREASYHRRHKRKHKPTWFEYRVFMPSHENLLSQNAAINELGLERIPNDKTLKLLVSQDDLVPLTNNKYVRVSSKLEAKRRFCRPWVDMFLQELGQEFFEQFEEPIQVNSAVRTIKTQTWLRRWNHNAAPAHGETSSAHLAGVAVDLQRRGLTRDQIRFIQQKLLYLAKLNMVIVEEELKQPCFHIVVTGDYPYPPAMPVIPFDKGVLDGLTRDLNNSTADRPQE